MKNKIKNSNLSVFLFIIWIIAIAFSVKIQDYFSADDFFNWTKDSVEVTSETSVNLFNGVTFPRGNYNVGFIYSSIEDLTLSVISAAEYDLATGGYKKYYETVLPAGKDMNFSADFILPASSMDVRINVSRDRDFSFTADNAVVKSSTACYSDSLIYALFYAVAITAAVALIKSGKKSCEDWYFILCLAAVCCIANSLYFTQATPHGHDMYFHLRRVEGIAQNILNGQPLRRINTVFNSGYGYINPVMYPEMFLYIPALFICCGMSSIGAVKLFYIIINITTVCVSYYSFTRISDSKTVGVCLSMVYSLAFYRMENIYIRSAMGESLFLAFLPLAVYALHTIMYHHKKRWLLFAMAVSAVIQSHILGSMLLLIFLMCEFAVCSVELIYNRRYSISIIIACIKAVAFTVMINLWFIVPFVYFYFTQNMCMFDKGEQLHYFILQVIPFSNMFSLKIVKTAIVENMGMLFMSALATATAIYVYIIRKSADMRIFATISFATAVGYGVLCTDVLPWQFLASLPVVSSFMAAIQFSSRFYGLFICAVCLFIARYHKTLPKIKAKYLFVAVVLVLGAFSTADLFANGGINTDDLRYNPYYYRAPREYLMAGTQYKNTADMLQYSDNITMYSYNKSGDRICADFEKTDTADGYIKLPLYHYYGYEAVNDEGDALYIRPGDDGCIVCTVTGTGRQQVNVYYNSRRKIFFYPSVISLLFIAAYLLYNIFWNYLRRQTDGKTYISDSSML